MHGLTTLGATQIQVFFHQCRLNATQRSKIVDAVGDRIPQDQPLNGTGRARRSAGQKGARPHCQETNPGAPGYLAPLANGKRHILDPIGNRNLPELAK
jgi:hypothetical protein